MVVLRGEAGIGNSRLVIAVSEVLVQHGFRVFNASCVDPDRMTPYALISDLMLNANTALAVTDAASARSVMFTREAVLGDLLATDRVPIHHAILAALERHDPPDGEVVAHLATHAYGAEGQDRTVDTRFFSRANRRSAGSSEIHDRIHVAPNQRADVLGFPPLCRDEGVRLGVIFGGTNWREGTANSRSSAMTNHSGERTLVGDALLTRHRLPMRAPLNESVA